MTLNNLARSAFAVLSLHCAQGTAQEVAAQLKVDCVGRMQISLPSEAEVAAHTAASWQLLGSARGDAMRFSDGQKAGWSRNTPFRISHRLNANEANSVMKHSEWTRAVFDERAKGNFLLDKKSFRTRPTTPWVGTAWSYRLSPKQDTSFDQSFLVHLDQNLVMWRSSGPDAVDFH